MEIMVDKVTKEQVPFFGVFSIFASNHYPIQALYASVINLKLLAKYSTKGLDHTTPPIANTTFCPRELSETFILSMQSAHSNFPESSLLVL